MGIPPARRLRVLRRHPDLVRRRDDLSVEFCALLNQTGDKLEEQSKAKKVLTFRIRKR